MMYLWRLKRLGLAGRRLWRDLFLQIFSFKISFLKVARYSFGKIVNF